MKIKKLFFLTLPSVFLTVAVLELFFTFVLPSSQIPKKVFLKDEKMICFTNKPRSGVYTIGKIPKKVGKWTINTNNWNYPNDYKIDKTKKTVAIIGDSYVEALQVDIKKSFSCLLNKKLGPTYQVFAFGMSGAPLSQYLHMSRYVKKNYNPDLIIFNLVYNDFNESLFENCKSQSFLSFKYTDENNIYEVEPQQPTKFRYFAVNLINSSSLLRYLRYNLKIQSVEEIQKNKKNDQRPDSYFNKTSKNYQITSYILKQIKKENTNTKILFVIDGPRSEIYENRFTGPHPINNMLSLISQTEFFSLLDLTDKFLSDFKKNKIFFDYRDDYHWNEYGHEKVAQAIFEFVTQQGP